MGGDNSPGSTSRPSTDLTDQELEELHARAEQSGMSVKQFIEVEVTMYLHGEAPQVVKYFQVLEEQLEKIKVY